MTAGYGWGMLSVGLTAILIGGLIAFFIINKVMEEKMKLRNPIAKELRTPKYKSKVVENKKKS